MSCMYVVLIWYLLMIKLQNVYTIGDDNCENQVSNTNDESAVFSDSKSESVNDDTKSFMNYSQLKTLITRSRSVYINGTIIDLDAWLPLIKNEEDEDNNENSKTMYTFLKCECADYIKTETKKINELLENCPSGASKNDPDKCKEGISGMQKLDDEISLTMTTLFAISDNYPNLKSHESYFLKTLLTAFLYIKSKFFGGHQINEIFTEISSIQELLKMKRIVLQITNLIRGFTSEHCYTTTNDIISEVIKARERSSFFDILMKTYSDGQSNDANNIIIITPIYVRIVNVNTERDLNTQPKNLHQFLTTVVALDYDPEYPKINMNDFMLYKCVMFNVPGDVQDVNNLCQNFSEKAFIQQTNINRKTSIFDLYKSIQHSYSVDSIYEYMLAVYKVMLKVIYIETDEILSKNTQEDIIFNSEEYGGLMRKLQLMNCPLEMMHHFKFLSKIQKHRYEDAQSIFDANENAKILNTIKINSLFYVDIQFKLNELNLSLKKFMDIILNTHFKQFWSIFSLLYKESETRSNRVYGLTLDLFPEGTGSLLNPNNEIKCKALIDVYTNFFIIQNMNNKSIITILTHLVKFTEAALTDTDIHFKQIRNRNTTFAGHLLDQLEKWSTVVYLDSDDDLLNIIINAVIHLKNESNTNIDTTIIFNTPLEDLVTLLINKHEKLNRIGDIIMNLFDNYQIRNCNVIKDRDFIYKNVYMKKINDNSGIPYIENLVEINFCPTPSFEVSDTFAMITAFARLLLNGYNTGTYSKDSISRDFYDISKLTANDRIKEFKWLGTDYRFNWYGDMKSIREIQIDIAEKMLNIRDLVEYQRIYIKGTFLFLLKQLHEKLNIVQNKNIQNYTFFKTIGDLNSIDFPNSYEVYTSNSNVIFAFYRILNIVYNKNAPNMFEIVCPMSKKLEVVQVSDKKTTARYNTFIPGLASNNNDVCSIIFSSTNDISYMISNYVKFFPQSLQNFKFTIPNY